MSPTLTNIVALPSPIAVTVPFSSTEITLPSSVSYLTFKPSGTVVATMVNVSSISKSNVELFTLTLASFKLTVTVIVLFEAASYLSSPAKLTVMMVLPSAKAIILPFSTLTTEELLTV